MERATDSSLVHLLALAWHRVIWYAVSDIDMLGGGHSRDRRAGAVHDRAHGGADDLVYSPLRNHFPSTQLFVCREDHDPTI